MLAVNGKWKLPVLCFNCFQVISQMCQNISSGTTGVEPWVHKAPLNFNTCQECWCDLWCSCSGMANIVQNTHLNCEQINHIRRKGTKKGTLRGEQKSRRQFHVTRCVMLIMVRPRTALSPQEQIKLQLLQRVSCVSCVCACYILSAYTLGEGLGHYLHHKQSGWSIQENVHSIQR